MLASPTRTATRIAIAALAGCAALAVTVSQTLGGSSGSAASQPTAGLGQVPAGEGPGGRTALVSWTLARDPGNRGLARSWQRGGFAGRGVSLPNVVDPNHITGAAGRRNYELALVGQPKNGGYFFRRTRSDDGCGRNTVDFHISARRRNVRVAHNGGQLAIHGICSGDRVQER